MSEDVKRDVRNPLLFECAWEVANKVGGIYTVIKTKVPVTVSEFGDRYCLIGPLSYKTAPMEVEAQEPSDPALASTLDAMRSAGVKCLYGRWLVEGSPRVLLFDTGSQYSRLDEWKGDLWNLAGIPTPPNDHETNETIIFGYIVAWFLGEVRRVLRSCGRRRIYLLVVCGKTIDDGGNRTLPRMASWLGNSPTPKASRRRDYRVHHSRDAPGTLSLRWKR